MFPSHTLRNPRARQDIPLLALTMAILALALIAMARALGDLL